MHEGHRARLADKVGDNSPLYEHELLEALLFNACPRRDLNETAHAIIQRFGSVADALSADEEELLKVKGVGENIAQYLVCIGKALAKCNGAASFATIKSSSQFIEFMRTRKTPEGEAELFFMDKGGRARRACSLSFGEDKARIIKLISIYNPYGIFAGRSGGDIQPDSGDDRLAGEIAFACNLSGVRFYDYCIVGDKDAFSYFVHDRLNFKE